MNSSEIWKPIGGFEGSYEISNLGRVKSLSRTVIDSIGRRQPVKEKLLKNMYDDDGYLYVTLSANGKNITKKPHRLVAQAFIPNPENKPEVNHKDGNKENNCVDNLEWVTNKKNIEHAFRTNLRSKEKDIEKCKQMSLNNCKKLICVETHQIFNSYVEAGKHFGVSASSIGECVHKGWRVKKKYHLVPYTNEV